MRKYQSRAEEREAIRLVLSAAWHALQSYVHGNASPELADETSAAIEQTAQRLEIEIEGVEIRKER